jgi:hypothetical protein
LRLVLSPTLVASNTNHQIAVGTTVQTQLDQIDDALPKILAVDPASTPTLNLATTILIGHKGNVLLCKTGNGALTIHLPTPVANFEFTIVDTDGSADVNNITITRHGTEKIFGIAQSYVFQAPYGQVTIYSDGTDWFKGAN